jgi:hypothetical protein
MDKTFDLVSTEAFSVSFSVVCSKRRLAHAQIAGDLGSLRRARRPAAALRALRTGAVSLTLANSAAASLAATMGIPSMRIIFLLLLKEFSVCCQLPKIKADYHLHLDYWTRGPIESFSSCGIFLKLLLRT